MQWYYFAIFSAIFSAFAAILEKKSLFKIDALDFSFWLAMANAIIALPFLFSVDFSEISYTTLLLLFSKSILGAFSFLYIMKGLKELQISSSLPLLAITPGLVALAAYFILNESLDLYEIAGMILLIIGTYILQTHREKDLLHPFRYIFTNSSFRYLLIALAIFTATSILDKLMVGKMKLPINSFMGFQHIFLAINFALIVFFSKSKKSKIIKSLQSSWKLILLISAITIIYRYSHIMAIKLGSVALVLTIKRFSVLFAVLIGGKLFSEQFLLRKTIATTIIIGGAILILL